MEEPIEHMKPIFSICEKNKFRLKAVKCKTVWLKASLFIRIVGADQIRVGLEQIDASGKASDP